MSLSIVNWNVEWATPRSRRTPEILDGIRQNDPEVVCLTEADNRLLSQDGYTICSQPDYGYPIKEGRRKVMLWSRNPWEQVDDVGRDSMPPGRFVAGATRSSLGQVTVIGICIPWFGSRTRDKRKERWEDHGDYLVGLREILERMGGQRVIVMGDFNQIIGQGSRAPRKIQLALRRALPLTLTIVSSEIAFLGRKSIDHIALSGDLAAESLEAINNISEGRRLSDHFGVAANLTGQEACSSDAGAPSYGTET
jgi:endonuclease/exonuclease/phosphatase family metal-dependent hydrolase